MKQEEAFKDYQAGMRYADIAKKYNVSPSTVKTWKRRYWADAPLPSRPKRVAKPKKLSSGVPPGTQNALKTGLFAKYLPEDVLHIVLEIDKSNPIEILWGNICIKYAQILKAQQIMHVKDASDSKRLVSKSTTIANSAMTGKQTSATVTEEEIAAEMRMASFMNAESKAMLALTKMIKQYDELCRGPLATEEQKARLDKLKAEVAEIKAAHKTDERPPIKFVFKRE